MRPTQLSEMINNGGLDDKFASLYGENRITPARERYLRALKGFVDTFGDEDDAAIFSVPGRSEISGNHTDHNHGKVIAASVDLDIIAVAAPKDGSVVKVKSEGFKQDTVDVSRPDSFERFRSSALIAGVFDGFEKRGFKTCAFDAFTTSDVLKGSGLSSSAAFENMIGTILNHFANGASVDFVTIAQISQYAENKFFGKPSGLMDQVACAAGGFVGIDFSDPASPIVERLDFDLGAHGYSLAIVNTGGNHADLNDEYAAITVEMRKVSEFFGKKFLREITKDELLEKLPKVRKNAGDRAVLRALHFFNENERVSLQLEALKKGDLFTFFDGVRGSGASSLQLLQNVFCCSDPAHQGLTLALSLCAELLGSESAWRVHGGGFAGTILVFIPTEKTDDFRKAMDGFFGAGACRVLKVRTSGAIKLA
ncbi:MAG: galactokinase [Clostridia bacterium]|nr:galactokinase [Clostridia bacterium]